MLGAFSSILGHCPVGGPVAQTELSDTGQYVSLQNFFGSLEISLCTDSGPPVPDAAKPPPCFTVDLVPFFL